MHERQKPIQSDWIVIQSSPSQLSFLKNILSRKFPSTAFTYRRFSKITLPKSALDSNSDGVIAELKGLTTRNLKTCDFWLKKFKDVPMILVLTPKGFALLNSKRKRAIKDRTIVLSEEKSLDYVLQLPRLIDDVGHRRRLKHQNERLKKMLFQRQEASGQLGIPAEDAAQGFSATKRLIEEAIQSQRTSMGALKVTLKNWRRLKNELSSSAQMEFLDTILRLIGRVVRNSDRVLRSEEDEFTILLSHAQPLHVMRCKERLEATLQTIPWQIETRGSLKGQPFDVHPVHPL